MRYRLTKGYKYILESIERVKVQLPDSKGNRFIKIKEGVLTIRKNYAWDGSSVPLKKWFKWIYDADRYCKKASLTHDALCQLMREGLLDRKYKEYIDGLYRDMCILGGMGKRQANLRYKFLRRFGDPYIQPEKNPRGRVFEV